MNQENLLERLSLQIKSFQEGFNLLTKAYTVKDLSKNFMHLLRANLMTAQVSLFYKPDKKSDWQEMCGPRGDCIQYISELETEDRFLIRYLDDGPIKVLTTLPMVDHSYFGLICGSKLDNSDYTDYDKIALQIFMQVLDNAYQSFRSLKKEKELAFSLNHSIVQLNSLIDTGIELSNLESNKSLLVLALERVVSITNASRGILKIKNGTKIEEKFYFPANFPTKKTSNHALKSSFKLFDRVYSFELFDKESRSTDDSFNSNDQLLLDGFSRQLAGALENDYLHEQELQHQKIEQEIALAATIQKKILPEKLPEIKGYDIYGMNIPTKHVGGDYYNCIPLTNGKFALVIADVSGKGVPAALLVNSLHSSLFAYMSHDIPLPLLAEKLNNVISDASTDETYITFFIAILDPETGQLDTLNAGHNPIYLQKNDGSRIDLRTGGIPFGMLDIPFPYEEKSEKIEPGERLLLYTDGITEAMNKDDEEYDQLKPLIKFLKNSNPKSAQSFIETLIEDIQNFTGNTPQSDDITALYLMRKS